jgi:hypothetical protein
VDSGQRETLLAHAEKLGLQAEDLDGAVHDLAQESALEELNALDNPRDQEAHISAREEYASAINNGGLEAQLELLLGHNSADEVRRLLDEAAQRKA